METPEAAEPDEPETPAEPEAAEPEPPDVCTGVVEVGEERGVRCDPGAAVPALCTDGVSTDLVGWRECGASGTSLGRTHCPDGTAELKHDGQVLVVTRPVLRAAPGFQALLTAIVSLGYELPVAVTVEDLQRSFPRPTAQESIVAGVAHFKSVDMPSLGHVLRVGKPTVERRENSAALYDDVEVPLWYSDSPEGTIDPNFFEEGVFPSTAHEKHPFSWPGDFGGRYRTPEWSKVDVHVGILPAAGATFHMGKDDTGGDIFKSDLEIFAAKLAAWDPGDTFVESQFDGHACHAENGQLDNDNGVHTGVSRAVRYHSCQDGEGGDTGPLATADGADFLFFNWHGGPGGSSDLGGYVYDGSTAFGGIVMGHSCSTGAPDMLPTSLGGQQLFHPEGAVAYVGYSRIVAMGLTNPMSRAFMAGRWTLGEAIDGMAHDRLGDLRDHRHADRDIAGLMIYGFTGLPLVKAPPAKSVRTLASRTNEDGTVSACVEVRGAADSETSLVVGKTHVADVQLDEDGSVVVPVTVPAEASVAGGVISLADCDTERETCRVAGLDPELAVTLQCGEITDMADGSLSVEVTSSNGVTGQMTYEVTATYFDCGGEEGVNWEYCYLDGWPWRRADRVVAAVPTDKVHAEGNVVPFDLAALSAGGSQEPGENELFRAVRVELKNAAGNVIGRCFPPMDETLAKDLGLI